MKKRILSLLLALSLLLVLGACGDSATPSAAGDADANGTDSDAGGAPASTVTDDAELVLRLAWTVAYQEDHPYSVAADTFKAVVEERTGGAIQVELYPGGQLGGDRDMFESIQMGTLDVCINSSPVIAGFTQVLVGVDMPYLFENDYDILWEAQTGEAGQTLLRRLEEETGVVALSFVFQPFRHFYTNKAINSIDDFAGLKLRSMESPVHTDIYSAMGMSPTTLPYNDIYSAMQQGTIDGFESDVIGAYTSKFYEVADYLTISGHFNNSIVLIMSPSVYDKLTPEQQAVMQEASDAAAKASWDITVAENDRYVREMENQGMTINYIDMEPVYAAVQPVIDKYCAETPEVQAFVAAVEALKAAR